MFCLTGLFVRILFVAVSVFVERPLNAAAFLSLFVMMSLLLHVYTLPYVSEQLDLLQSFLLSSLLSLALGGILFANPLFVQLTELEVCIFVIIIAMWVGIAIIFTLEIIAKAERWVSMSCGFVYCDSKLTIQP